MTGRFVGVAVIRARLATIRLPSGQEFGFGPVIVIETLLSVVDLQLDRQLATERDLTWGLNTLGVPECGRTTPMGTARTSRRAWGGIDQHHHACGSPSKEFAGPGGRILDLVRVGGDRLNSMDQKDKASIASILDRDPKDVHRRLVLGLASPSRSAVKVGEASIKNRTEYRKALIERQRSLQTAYVHRVAAKLSEHGLVVQAHPLTNTIVVEGGANQLAFALRDKRVETAAFDDELTLIEPIKG